MGYQKGEFEALGVDFRQRGALTDEALEVLDRAWAGGPVTMKGLNFNAAGNEPRPIPKPRPPIWVGGSSDKALDRAARWGDGWGPFYSTPGMAKINAESGIVSIDHLKERIERLQEKRAALGRAGLFDIVLGPRMRIKDRTPERAERYLEALDELAGAGVTWATINFAHPSRAEYIELVQWFGVRKCSRALSPSP